MFARWRHAGTLLMVGAMCNGAHADDVAAQRARIASERAEVQAGYDARAAECQQRFVVTSCMNEARRQRRDALDRLQRQQVLLDEAQRKQRAAARVDAIRNKVAAEESATRPPPRVPAATLRLRDAPLPARHEAAPTPPPSREPAAHAAAAEQSRQTRLREQQARQAEAQVHRQAVERRNAQRAASGKKAAAPLPLPASPAASPPR